MEVDERSDQKSDIQLHWMATYEHLKNELTEDKKYHNLMRWLIWPNYLDKQVWASSTADPDQTVCEGKLYLKF